MTRKPNTAQYDSIDAKDVAGFEALAEQWWDQDGPFKPLHAINPVRLTYLREKIAKHFERDASSLKSLEGLNILDIGCGGGLICEPLARMGAQVTGLDAGAKNIEAAKLHAEQSGLDTYITYHAEAAEDFINEREGTYDVVLALELLEHVNDPQEFVSLVMHFCKPDGVVIFSTLNRTLKSLALGKIAAEYILNLVPAGTHQWNKFIKPSELSRWVRQCGGKATSTCGLVMNVKDMQFALKANDIDINYFMSALPARSV